MDTSKLRKFASFARSALIEQVGTRLRTVLAEKSMARRESPKVVEELEKKIKDLGEKRVLEIVAYTWFNRFCALRYMDVNRYTRIGVLSPADGQFQPEILAEAKMGHIDEELVPEATRKQVMRLLDGSDKSADPQGEAYRLLLVAVCNYYHSLMPFMFEKIADYTELLLPDDLLSGTSIPAYTREALLPINCSPEHTEESVEVIGWLYQFYIADKKDEVFDGLKKGKKITAEHIPAATQLFTPHWIVRYLVENSLGRLWMLNHPESKLVERMDYYIQPEESETDFLKTSSPEEIKVCDPACGSGHMLTYAFDLLYAIYREEQYPELEIPTLILKNNLHGIEIDQRAGALAAFALTMKAREKDKRFFTRKAQSSASDLSSIENTKSKIQNPNICVLENIKIDSEDLSAYMDTVGRDLFTSGLQGLLNQWEEADNFGSLIRPLVTDVSEVLELLRERQMGEDLFLAGVHQKVLKALRQADYLSPKYHVVVANPPYIGSKNTNPRLKQLALKSYFDGKADVYSMFILRTLEMVKPKGYASLMTPFTWMFISSFEELRAKLFEDATLLTLVRPEYHAFFDSAFVPICAFVLRPTPDPAFLGSFIDLNDFYGADVQGPKAQEAILNPDCGWFYTANANDFKKIAGAPVAFGVSESARATFQFPDLKSASELRAGITTGDNDKYVRCWFEVARPKFAVLMTSKDELWEVPSQKWVPLKSGGDFRKWYGNNEKVICFDSASYNELKNRGNHCASEDRYFERSLTWSAIGATDRFGVRYCDDGFVFTTGSHSIFAVSAPLNSIAAFLCSSVAAYLSQLINPTLNSNPGDIARLPFTPDEETRKSAKAIADASIQIARTDWDNYEVSWDFQEVPLLADRNATKIEVAWFEWKQKAVDRTYELKQLEQRNNRLFIESYRLDKELTGDVEDQYVTLKCNAANRYSSNQNESELEALLRADTMREFMSYAVGCMLGRYSLDKPGLILANQGETIADYRRQIPEPTFAPDEDNVIPILEGEWFSDDISQRFKGFLKIAFGAQHYDENLEFLENALYTDNPTAKKRKTIRDYFLKEFYDHHLKMYKKRPIYWLFSSPKGTFNAMIYMHRYRTDTAGKVLECLRDFRDKLSNHADHQQMVADSGNYSPKEKTAAIKQVTAIKKQLKELEDYEKTLFEVAAKKISIDLDDGVKHNYPLFGSVLRKIPGLDAKED